jgi:hypothetical protein
MEWIVLHRTDTPQQQIYWDYDENGDPIPNTDRIFDYVMVYTLVEYFFPQYDKRVKVNWVSTIWELQKNVNLKMNNHAR